MVSLTLSSRASSLRSTSHHSLNLNLPSAASPISSAGSASSSTASLTMEDEENVTITAKRALISNKPSKQKSSEDLRFLAISTHMTELSYSISDIQTRIFEIQELRHKSQSSGDTAGITSIIDQSLMSLDERLESAGKGMQSINDSLEPLLQSAPTPTLSQNGDMSENALILRKHATLTAEWIAVQDESEVLREELKEDKWLTVFRTVTDQADGMMSSLEKAVNRCQDFIWQVHRRGGDDLSLSQLSLSASHRSDKAPLNSEVFNSLLDSFEAKKKHYMPATSKVLSIIDKGVQDRVTKNGETLRRHAESAQRWRNLRERISRTDAEMENVRKVLLSGDTPSENGSSTSGTMSTRNGYLATPISARSAQSRAPSTSSTISRSMSPFRKFARRITGTTRTTEPVTPLTLTKVSSRTPSSEPARTLRHHKTSIFSFRGGQPPTPVTPDRPGHKYSHSLTPDSSPRGPKQDANANSATKSKSSKQRWNSSTKVEQEERVATVKATPPRRPSAMGMYTQAEDVPPVPPLGTPHQRSISRSSMASSRPWSPVTSSISTAASSHAPLSMIRPPSRAETPSNIIPITSLGTTPRSRPKTPSHIPAPAKWRSISDRQSDGGCDDDENPKVLIQRAFSPALSASGKVFTPPPRPPSRSMIPVPSLQFSSASRPSSTMSQYRSESPPDSSFRNVALRAQTPESALRAKVQQVPFYQGRTTARPILHKLPPSSFRDGSLTRTPVSRPSSRAGAYTPSSEQNPAHQYIPGSTKDPLDTEVAAVVNSIAHGLLVERVDPPLRTAPREGEEIRAQYAFSNSLSRKVVTCRLTTLTRTGGRANGDTTTKKVMCRVGGGWQDLQLYMLNRQAGM